MQLISASEALQVVQGSEHTAIGLLPYTSNATRVTSESLPWHQAVNPESIRLSRYSRIVVMAAARLVLQPETQNFTLVAAGEHTFGRHNPSTTELMYRELTRRDVPSAVLANERPTNANTTAAQLHWLAKWRKKHTSVNQSNMLLVGHRQHAVRTAVLGNRMELSDALFVDAAEFVEKLNNVNIPATYDYERKRAIEAMALFNKGNAAYEARALKATQTLTQIGATGVRLAYWAGSRIMSPTIVDAVHTATNNSLRFEGPLPARKKIEQLQKHLITQETAH